MKLEDLLQGKREEGGLTKLSAEDQDAYGRIAARGFMNRLSELSFGEDTEVEKEAAISPKVKKALKIAGLVGGGAAAGGAGYVVGRKKESAKKTQQMRAILSHLVRTGRLR